MSQQPFPNSSEEILLLGGRAEDAVEGKGVPIKFDLIMGVDNSLIFAAWPDTDYHLDGISI